MPFNELQNRTFFARECSEATKLNWFEYVKIFMCYKPNIFCYREYTRECCEITEKNDKKSTLWEWFKI